MIKKITKKKLFHLFFIFLVSVGVFIYLWRFINSYLSRSRATSTSATLSILPSSTNMSVNDTKEFQLIMQFSGGNASEKIDYLRAVVNFPKNYLELADYVDTTLSGLDRQMRVDGPVAANGSGMIVIELGAIAPSSGPSTNSLVTVAKIKFKGKTAGSGQITIGEYQIVNNASEEIKNVSINSSQITVSSTGASTPTPTRTPTRTPTPAPTRTPTPQPNATNLTLNLSLRFQGIVNQCPVNNKKIKVKVKLGGRTNTEYKSTDFSCNQGKWTGSLTFNATPGSGYIVYVKGEKHLQKKICDKTPQESRLGPGTYNCRSGQITLNSGTNNLNFTGIVNLYGDLPVGGEQDGVINSLDSSFIRNNLGKNDPQVLAICDGNLDNKCDTQDWSMLIMALSIKGDEL